MNKIVNLLTSTSFWVAILTGIIAGLGKYFNFDPDLITSILFSGGAIVAGVASKDVGKNSAKIDALHDLNTQFNQGQLTHEQHFEGTRSILRVQAMKQMPRVGK